MVRLPISLPTWGCTFLLVATHAPLALGSIFAREDVQWELALLNLTVGGRLHQATPWELPCFSEYDGESVTPDEPACAAIQANYTSPFERVKHFGAYMMVRVWVIGWGTRCERGALCSRSGRRVRCSARRASAF